MNRIKTSKHTIKFLNFDKTENLKIFSDEYKRCLSHFIDFIWKNGYSYKLKTGNVCVFNVLKNQLNCPTMFSSKIIKDSNLKTFLTGRALKCCMTQAAGMIKSSVEKQRKRLYKLEEFKSNGYKKTKIKLLVKKIKQNIPQKPNAKNIKIELNSICCDFKETTGIFNGFLRLKSITTTKMDIKIPVKYNRHSNKLKKNGVIMSSFLISNDSVDIRWNLNAIPHRTDGDLVGADQGLKDVITFSNGIKPPKKDCHGHSLDSILDKVSRKKKGGKAFKKAKNHQKNFINWSINQLNFNNIKQINLENIWNIGYRKSKSKKLSHWQNTLIRDKIKSKCDDLGIRLILQSSTYRSQRCSCCGIVQKANRKGKLYQCKNCGTEIDSDLNAAKNHHIELPEIPYALRNLNLNRKGFFWKPDGLFALGGRNLQFRFEKNF